MRMYAQDFRIHNVISQFNNHSNLVTLPQLIAYLRRHNILPQNAQIRMATYLAQERKYVQSWPKTTLIVQMASYQVQKTFTYVYQKVTFTIFFVFILLCLNLVVKLFEVNDNQNSWESMTK